MTLALFLGIAFSALQSSLIGVHNGDNADIKSANHNNSFIGINNGDNADIK